MQKTKKTYTYMPVPESPKPPKTPNKGNLKLGLYVCVGIFVVCLILSVLSTVAVSKKKLHPYNWAGLIVGVFGCMFTIFAATHIGKQIRFVNGLQTQDHRIT